MGKPDDSAKMSLRDTLQNMSRSCCHRNWKRIRNGFRRGELILKGGICVECGVGGDAWHCTSELSMVPDTRWSFKKCLLNKCAEKWSSYRNILVPKCGKNWSGRKVQNLSKTDSSVIVCPGAEPHWVSELAFLEFVFIQDGLCYIFCLWTHINMYH